MTELIGHRGIPVEAPENSISGFLRAVEAGAHAVELDVRATADQTLVVHHDAEVTTPGGTRVSLSSSALRDLRSAGCDADSLPTLYDVLGAVDRRARLYVEIKAKGVESLVANLLRDHSDWCAVHSFDHLAVKRLHLLEPKLPCGVLLVARLVDPAAVLRDTGATDYWQEASNVDRDLVASVRQAGGRVIAWTVNDPSDALALLEVGVDGICTDDVRSMRRLLG